MTTDARPPARRRGGARRAKHAAREAATAAGTRAIRAGLGGGTYRPLSDADVQRIHAGAMHVLSTIGFAGHHQAMRDLALPAGATLNDEGRLCFPVSMVEDILGRAAGRVVLQGRDPAHDLDVSGERVHFGTGGAAVQVLDPNSGVYRDSTLKDLYDLARLVDRLPNVHWFTRCVIATDLPDPLELDINTAYACAAGTTKHMGTAITTARNVAPVLELFDAVLGGEGRFKQRPFCKLHTSPIVPPLRFGADALDVIIEAVAGGMPINAITAAQSGATAPASLAGTLVQTIAETLGALVFVNLLSPGHPFIFSNWPFVSDLRTGQFSGGGAEEALLNAASAQLANFYGMPGGVAAGMSDSKLPDAQAGFEKGLTIAMAGLAGANLVYESAGMLASLLGCSHESMVIDDEILGLVLRGVRGIEVNDETLALDVIAQVVREPGHYLATEQTLALMETEYLYPGLSDRSTPGEWTFKGAHDIRDHARAQVRSLLDSHYPTYIDARADAAIRARFPIRLEKESMCERGSQS